MLIKYSDIVLQLKQLNIEFYNEGSFEDEYIIASIFKPIDKGFYFYSNNESLPSQIKNSLILVKEDFLFKDKENHFIVVPSEADPQEIFYQIIANLYARKPENKISKFAIINPNCKVGKNVEIGAFCEIEEDVSVGNNVIIGSQVKIHKNTILGDNVVIESNSVIGAQGVAWTWNKNQTKKIVLPQLGGVEIKNNSFLGAQTVIVRGSLNENTIIGENCLLAPGCRIGHGTIIEDYCHLANNITTGGNTKIGANSFIGSGAIFRPKVNIHAHTIVGAGALVIKNTSTENKTLMGFPAKEYTTSKNPSGMPKPKKIKI